MPYRDPDPEDPMELVAVPLPVAGEGGLRAKAEVFVEELLRAGHDPEAVLRIFRDPFYTAAHEVYEALGEAEIGSLVARTRLLFQPDPAGLRGGLDA